MRSEPFCLAMPVPIYQVDAFARRPFAGNPAAVCPLTEWLLTELMQQIAAENNLAETAFFIPLEEGKRSESTRLNSSHVKRSRMPSSA